MKTLSRSNRLALFESNWGHDFGWNVYLNNKLIAVLDNSRFHDMYWVLFDFKSVSSEYSQADLASDQFWDNEAIVFRNRGVPVESNEFIVRWHETLPQNCVVVRGWIIDRPSLWEELLLLARRVKRLLSEVKRPSVPTQGLTPKDLDEKDEEKPQPTQGPKPPPAPK